MPSSEVWGMSTTDISVWGVTKRFPQKVSLGDKRRALSWPVLNHPNQLATHILDTTTTGEDLSVTRLT